MQPMQSNDGVSCIYVNVHFILLLTFRTGKKFEQVILNFKQKVNKDDDEIAILSWKCKGWTEDDTLHRVIKKLAPKCTVFYAPTGKIAKAFNDGDMDLIFSFTSKSGSKSHVNYNIVKSEDGHLEYIIGYLWCLTGQEEQINTDVSFKK